MKISLVVIGIKSSGNLGALARVCDNFNVDNLILVDPQCEVDEIAYERATKSRKYLDNIIILNTLDEAKEYADVLVALSARTGGFTNIVRTAVPITYVPQKLSDFEGRLAFVLGREDSGLTNNEVHSCDILATIPLPGDNPVLNISHAASLSLWEFIRAENIEIDKHEHLLMTREEKKAFEGFLRQILSHAWIENKKHDMIVQIFNTILSRSFVSGREASALIGTLRSILRSLDGDHPPWDSCKKGD
jgi:tRNA/rRNA methyltransferase